MLHWLHSHKTLRGTRAPLSHVALLRGDTVLGSDQPGVTADLIGQAAVPAETGAPTVANDVLWLPPLWLSW